MSNANSVGRRVGSHEYGVRVEFSSDVAMGNRDSLWTISAGTTGTTAKLQYGFGVKLDGCDGPGAYVYADARNLQRIADTTPNTPISGGTSAA